MEVDSGKDSIPSTASHNGEQIHETSENQDKDTEFGALPFPVSFPKTLRSGRSFVTPGSGPLTPQSVLRLQQTVGNRAVRRLLLSSHREQQKKGGPFPPSVTRSSQTHLQRTFENPEDLEELRKFINKTTPGWNGQQGASTLRADLFTYLENKHSSLKKAAEELQTLLEKGMFQIKFVQLHLIKIAGQLLEQNRTTTPAPAQEQSSSNSQPSNSNEATSSTSTPTTTNTEPLPQNNTVVIAGGFPYDNVGLAHILEAAKKYAHVVVVDLTTQPVKAEYLKILKDLGENRVIWRLGKSLTDIGALGGRPLIIPHPNPNWRDLTLAANLDTALGSGDTAFILTDGGPITDFLKSFQQKPSLQVVEAQEVSTDVTLAGIRIIPNTYPGPYHRVIIKKS